MDDDGPVFAIDYSDMCEPVVEPFEWPDPPEGWDEETFRLFLKHGFAPFEMKVTITPRRQHFYESVPVTEESE